MLFGLIIIRELHLLQKAVFRFHVTPPLEFLTFGPLTHEPGNSPVAWLKDGRNPGKSRSKPRIEPHSQSHSKPGHLAFRLRLVLTFSASLSSLITSVAG